MSTLTTHTTASRDSHSIGLCKFNTTTKAIEVSDGTDWLIYDYDSIAYPTLSNTYSADLDGADDYLDLGSSTYFDTSSALSLSAWAKLDSTSGYPILWSLRTSGSTGWKMGFSAASSYAPMYMGSNSGFSNLKGGGSSLLTNIVSDFHHIVLTYNGNGTTTASNWKLYINGTEETLISAGAIGATSNTTSYIGRDSAGNYLNGKVDEAAIYDIELSQSQIDSLYAGGQGVGDSDDINPLAWWRMGDTGTEGSGGSSTISNAASGTNSLGSSADATWQNGSSGNTSPTYSTDAP